MTTYVNMNVVCGDCQMSISMIAPRDF